MRKSMMDFDPDCNVQASLPTRLLTFKEAARVLGCSASTVYSLRETGALPVVSIGPRKGYRVELSDLQAFIERRKQQIFPAPADESFFDLGKIIVVIQE